MEWNRRIAMEKELSKDPSSFRFLNISYDFSGNFLIYPSILGIRVYNLISDKVSRELGKGENIRFLGVALCRAVPNVTTADLDLVDNPNLKKIEPDPMLVSSIHRLCF